MNNESQRTNYECNEAKKQQHSPSQLKTKSQHGDCYPNNCRTQGVGSIVKEMMVRYGYKCKFASFLGCTILFANEFCPGCSFLLQTRTLRKERVAQGRQSRRARDLKLPKSHTGITHHDRLRAMELMSSVSSSSKNQNSVMIKSNSDSSAAAKPKIKFGLLPDFMQKDPLAVTKMRWEESKKNSVDSTVTDPDEEDMRMMTMSVLSLALAVSVVYALSSSAPEMVASDQFEESSNFINNMWRDGNVERLEIATRNIAATVIPQSAEDVIAVSIGEGIAGVIGAFATWVLGLVLNFKREEELILTPLIMELEGMPKSGGKNNVDALVSEAVADGDYFLTRAAAQPLFEAVGVPVFFASLASVLLATLPYEAIKLSTRKRMNCEREEILLNMLEEEEVKRRANMNVVDKVSSSVGGFIQQLYVTPNVDEVDFDEDDIEMTTEEAPPILDFVELFADITKWLEYDVLISNYRGILTLPSGTLLNTAFESAIFGLLAALSSQLYTDVLYLYSDFGSPTKRDQTLNRSIGGWASVYATECLSAATLFGVYEAVRAPTSKLVSRLVSGGVGGCVGSQDYDLCIETYLFDNSGVSVTNWLDSFSWIIPLNFFVHGASASY